MISLLKKLLFLDQKQTARQLFIETHGREISALHAEMLCALERHQKDDDDQDLGMLFAYRNSLELLGLRDCQYERVD